MVFLKDLSISDISTNKGCLSCKMSYTPKMCVDWSQIDDREIFMKGIDYSYYYEQEE